MKIFYLNCFRLLKHSKNGQREWLIKYINENDIDVVCLAESSNYDIGDDFSESFPKEYRWKPPESELRNMGFKFNICSKHKVEFTPINYTVPPELSGGIDNTLVGYGEGTIIRMKFDCLDSVVTCVHIKHKKTKSQKLLPGNAFYEFGLRILYDHMISEKPIVVFGDFNNYPDDKSFLRLTEESDYRDVKINKIPYSYKRSPKDTGGVLIDHAFSNRDNVQMEYVDAIGHNFNHHGMLINVNQ